MLIKTSQFKKVFNGLQHCYYLGARWHCGRVLQE